VRALPKAKRPSEVDQAKKMGWKIQPTQLYPEKADYSQPHIPGQ
jgi:hypothetical protein